MWVPLPASKTTITTTMVINTQVATTSPPITTSCKTCNKGGAPCPFCVQPAPLPSPQESKWSDKDWNGDRQREREKTKKKEQQQKVEVKRNKKEQVPEDYFPLSPIYDSKNKEDTIPHYDPKMKEALDPNYYPLSYVPK